MTIEILTNEQKEQLLAMKPFLDTPDGKKWAIEEQVGLDAIQKLIQRRNFDKGGDFSSDDLDELFRLMKYIMSNRALNSLLYSSIGISEFNAKLRTLLYSNEPLPERINQFLEMRGVARTTASHFLCAFHPEKFPMTSSDKMEQIGCSTSQLESARKIAIDEFSIDEPSKYFNDTINYLAELVIFREVREVIGAQRYNRINDLLWKMHLDTIEKGERGDYTSVGLENDLRRYLAQNPGLIEKGMRLIEEEKSVATGRMDLLCEDRRKRLVVIEFKKERGSDAVVGQILRYVGCLQDEMPDRKIRGMIIVNEPDDKLLFAVKPVPNLEVKYYKVRFEVTDIFE